MNIVSDTGSVGGGVVVTENAQLLSFTSDNFLDEGEQVVGINIGLVSNESGLVCTAGVEVAQGDDSPVFMQFSQGVKEHLNCGLGLTIRSCGVLHVSLAAVILITIHCSS